MPQSLNWWVQSSFSGTHSARKHATWPLNFGDKLQIEHFRPQPWTLKTLPKGSNCIHFKYRFNVVMKRTHFFLYDNLITENKFARCLNINQRGTYSNYIDLWKYILYRIKYIPNYKKWHRNFTFEMASLLRRNPII